MKQMWNRRGCRGSGATAVVGPEDGPENEGADATVGDGVVAALCFWFRH